MMFKTHVIIIILLSNCSNENKDQTSDSFRSETLIIESIKFNDTINLIIPKLMHENSSACLQTSEPYIYSKCFMDRASQSKLDILIKKNYTRPIFSFRELNQKNLVNTYKYNYKNIFISMDTLLCNKDTSVIETIIEFYKDKSNQEIYNYEYNYHDKQKDIWFYYQENEYDSNHHPTKLLETLKNSIKK